MKHTYLGASKTRSTIRWYPTVKPLTYGDLTTSQYSILDRMNRKGDSALKKWQGVFNIARPHILSHRFRVRFPNRYASMRTRLARRAARRK